MHLAADRSGDPAGVPTRLGGVDGGNQWYIEEFGQGDGGMGHQPIVGVNEVGHPAVARIVFDGKAGAHHGVAHGQGPGHHVRAEHELMRILSGGHHPYTLADLIGGRVRAGIGVGGPAAEHHDLVSGFGQRGGQVVHVSAQTADDDGRVLP